MDWNPSEIFCPSGKSAHVVMVFATNCTLKGRTHTVSSQLKYCAVLMVLRSMHSCLAGLGKPTKIRRAARDRRQQPSPRHRPHSSKLTKETANFLEPGSAAQRTRTKICTTQHQPRVEPQKRVRCKFSPRIAGQCQERDLLSSSSYVPLE